MYYRGGFLNGAAQLRGLRELINFVSSRYLSVRTFVAIAEVINPTALTVSDLYYLATLVFGARQFYQKFNARFTRLHIIETGGNRWIRQTTMDPLKKPSAPGPGRMISVGDFLTRLRPHIDDILQILPDAVVNDEEFFAVAKLVCGWNGGHEEERIWESIRLDRAKFQEFHEAYRPFFRIEIRMGTIYLRKLTYDDDYDDLPLDIETTPSESCLISAIKSYSSPEDPEKKEKKKGVSYAAEIELITPESPTSTSRCTQTSHLNTDQLWSLEREVIRLLKRDNEPFAAFIETKEAREMFRYQFLIDVFKQKDLHYLAYILERTLQETREEAWKETTALRNAAEEAQILLELAREQHRKEFGELQTRMETISRFEAFEVEVASNTRIDGLKERIKELQQDREVMLREEVKEERARQARQLREMKEKHKEEKRAFANEIQRLREENARLIAERDEMASRCENQMNKAKQMCETSSRLLLDSQREIHSLRGTALDPNRPSTSAAFYSSSIPSPSPVEMTPEAKRQMKIMMKYAAEIDVEELRSVARGLLEEYTEIGANHKERKTAEKQLKEFEAILEDVDVAIKENIQMIKLNVVEGLIPIPTIPTPFSETVLNKMRALRREKKKEEELFERSEEEEDGCLICTEPVEEGDDVVRCGTCAKEYHYGCISKWLKINSVCPQCSRALKDPNEYPELE
uniref:RING-type E3 ubiquitin transferase n=1 Tax=Caenorhabditis tropicalis TaxID=1561998 RepID=A0A1I7U508_9PELO